MPQMSTRPSYKNSRDKKCSKEFSLSIDAIHYYLQGDLVAERLREIAVHAKEIANQSSSTNTTDSFPTFDDQIKQERLAQAIREEQEEQEEQERLAQAIREEQEEQEEQERLAQEVREEQEEQEEQERLAQAIREEQEARGRSGL